MKPDVKLCSELRKKYNHHLKSGQIQFRSFHDLLWQISVNGILEKESEPVLFHIDVTGEFGTQLVLAYCSGGYKNTGVYFVSDSYSECSDLAKEINELFFQVNKKEQMKLISKSMFS